MARLKAKLKKTTRYTLRTNFHTNVRINTLSFVWINYIGTTETFFLSTIYFNKHFVKDLDQETEQPDNGFYYGLFMYIYLLYIIYLFSLPISIFNGYFTFFILELLQILLDNFKKKSNNKNKGLITMTLP